MAACGGGGGPTAATKPPPVTTIAPAAPTLTLAQNSIAAGASNSIAWSSVNATSCTASGSAGWTGSVGTSGGFTFVEPAVGTYTFTLACANSAGSSKATTVTLRVTPDPPAPSGLSYSPLQPYYYVNEPIIPLTPTVTGTVTSWELSKLPPGLTFNAANGVLSGTPTAAVASTEFLVCARNLGGNTCVTLTFGVEIPPSFFYGSCSPRVDRATVQYTLGVPAQTLTPLIQGACNSVTTIEAPWSVSPALPAGLILDNSTGSIGGTPTVLSAPTQYAITAGGPGGQSSMQLTIGVSSDVLLDLGHAAALQSIQFDDSHVLSQDTSGHWVLWNYTTMAQITSGQSPAASSDFTSQLLPVDLAGPTVVVVTGNGLELRSSATGQVTAEISVQPSWWQLASDGSYVCAADKLQLSCWSPAGQLLFSKSGNYTNAAVFAAPGGLLVAVGPAGAEVIETVSATTWTSSVGAPFQGEFQFWFVDGAAFLTRDNDYTVFVYSPTGTLEDQRTLPTAVGLNGVGQWFWTYQNTNCDCADAGDLTLYAVGNSAAPTATYSLAEAIPSGTYITALSGTGPGALTVIDLSGASPIESSYSVPVSDSTYAFNPYAFSSPSHYMVGTTGGLLIDQSTAGSPRTFDYGAVTNLAGGTARAVFTTASGNTFSYNAASNAFETAVDLSSSRQYVLSADGSVLATIEPGPASGAESVEIYSLPSRNVLNSFSYAAGSPSPQNITLSASGTTLGELLSVTGVQQSLPVNGGVPLVYATQGAEPVQLSPDGTLVAISSAGPYPTARTSLYNTGSYVTTVVGYPLAWLDDGRLLVDTYNSSGILIGSNIFSPTGNLLAVAPIGPLDTIQVVSSDLVYAPQLNEVLSLSGVDDGWASGDACGTALQYNDLAPISYTSCFGAYTSSAVVFVSGNLVLAQPH